MLSNNCMTVADKIRSLAELTAKTVAGVKLLCHATTRRT